MICAGLLIIMRLVIICNCPILYFAKCIISVAICVASASSELV